MSVVLCMPVFIFHNNNNNNIDMNINAQQAIFNAYISTNSSLYKI